jgi:polyferredoxin
MDKVSRPRGLIRYESEENIAHSRKTKFNWRIAAYSCVLLLLTSALVIMLVTRDDVDARILRTAGQMFQTLPDGRVSNLYNIKLVNKTRKEIPMTMKLENMKGEITLVQKDLIVPKESYFQTSFFVKIERQLIEKRKTPIVLGVYRGDKKIETIETTFLGPGY